MEERFTKRGSQKLMAAWKARVLTDESVREIAEAVEASPATLLGANVVGGTHATGMTVALSYEGDDIPRCGNDIQFWLKWHLIHGGTPHPPRIIINGIPNPELLRLELDFGHVGNPGPATTVELPGAIRGGVEGV